MKRCTFILLFFAFRTFAQTDSIVINPYKIDIEKLTHYNGIKFETKICGNGCAYYSKDGYLHLKDSSNYLYLSSNKKEFLILSLFPNLFFIDYKNNSLFKVKFNSKVLHFYGDDSDNSPSGADEANTICDPCQKGGVVDNQFLFQLTDSGLPKLVIKWVTDVPEGTAFYREFLGIKIFDFETFQCLFDDIYTNKMVSNDETQGTNCFRDIKLDKNRIIISNSKCETIENKKITDISNINNEDLSIRKPGIYIYLNGKFRYDKQK